MYYKDGFNGKRQMIQQIVLGELARYLEENNSGSYITAHIKAYPRGIEDLNVKGEIRKSIQ